MPSFRAFAMWIAVCVLLFSLEIEALPYKRFYEGDDILNEVQNPSSVGHKRRIQMKRMEEIRSGNSPRYGGQIKYDGIICLGKPGKCRFE